jgi:hypothetical protein
LCSLVGGYQQFGVAKYIISIFTVEDLRGMFLQNDGNHLQGYNGAVTQLITNKIFIAAVK